MFLICLVSIIISGLIAMKYNLNPVVPSSNNGENYNFKYILSLIQDLLLIFYEYLARLLFCVIMDNLNTGKNY